MIELTSNESQNQYLKILEYFPRSITKRICKTESSSSLKYIHLCTQYLVGLLYHNSTSVRCGMERSSVTLLSNAAARGTAFSSSIVGSTVSHLLLKYPIDSRWGSVRHVVWPSTIISWSANHLEVFWHVGRC